MIRTDLLTDLLLLHFYVYTHTSLLPAFKTWKQMFFFCIIFKGTRQATFLTKLKFNGDFFLSFFKIDWMTELQSFSKFFFWRPSGFATLSVERDEVGSLMDKIESRVSLFILIAKSDLGPLASYTMDLCTIILSNLEQIFCNSSETNGIIGLSVWNIWNKTEEN